MAACEAAGAAATDAADIRTTTNHTHPLRTLVSVHPGLESSSDSSGCRGRESSAWRLSLTGMDGLPIAPEEVLLSVARQAGLDAFGDSGSADTLYLQYAPILRRIARRKYDVPVSDVDALVHDVFATYLTNPSAVRNLRGYLIGGICNASRQYWRERRREVPLCNDESVLASEGIFDGLAERLTVAATVARLRSRCRDILRRYYFEGESTESIATAIETTPRNVIYLLHVCRSRARKIYEILTKVR